MVLIAAPMASSGGSGITLLLPLILIIGMIWFMSRTQRKQRQRQADTVAALKPGTKVVTTSGVVGIVEEVDDEYVTLEISDGVLVQFVKQAIGRVIPDEVDETTLEQEAELDAELEDAARKDDDTADADAKEPVDVPDAGKGDAADKADGADKAQDKKLPPTHSEN